MSRAAQRVEVSGVAVDPVSWEELLGAVAGWVGRRSPVTISYANVHVCNEAARDPGLREFLAAADLVYCDGNGVRLGAALLGERLPHRMTGADWIWSLAETAARSGWRLYWLGGRPGVSASAAAALQARFPNLIIGTDHGYHPRSGPEDAGSVQRINAFEPDILLVGMGTPEQEHYVAARRDALDVPVVWCVGATADYLAGAVRRGPRWLTDRAEFLDRLWSDPSRLWRRYLPGNARFLARVLAERLGRG